MPTSESAQCTFSGCTFRCTRVAVGEVYLFPLQKNNKEEIHAALWRPLPYAPPPPLQPRPLPAPLPPRDSGHSFSKGRTVPLASAPLIDGCLPTSFQSSRIWGLSSFRIFGLFGGL